MHTKDSTPPRNVRKWTTTAARTASKRQFALWVFNVQNGKWVVAAQQKEKQKK